MLSGLAVWIGTRVGGFAADKGLRRTENFIADLIRGRRNLHPKTDKLATHLEACAEAAMHLQIEFEKIIGSLYWTRQDKRMIVGAIGRSYQPREKCNFNINVNPNSLFEKARTFASSLRTLNEEVALCLDSSSEPWTDSLRTFLKPVLEETISILRPSWGAVGNISDSWRVVSQASEEQSSNRLSLLKRLDATWTPHIFREATFEKISWEVGHVDWSPERAQYLMVKLRIRLFETLFPALYLSVPQPLPAKPGAGEIREIAFFEELDPDVDNEFGQHDDDEIDQFDDYEDDAPYRREESSFKEIFLKDNEFEGYIVLGLPVLATLAEFCARDRNWSEGRFRYVALLCGKSRMRTRILPADSFAWVGRSS